MVQLNGHNVTPRHNRPGVLGNTYLEFFFINNGAFAHPYEVCSVHIFADTTNGDSSELINSSGTLDSSTVSSLAKMEFTNSATVLGTLPDSSGFDPTGFGDDVNTASAIYRIGDGEGHFAVALKPNALWAGGASANSASSTGKYFDIWTVVDVNGSDPRTYVHAFELFRDVIFSITEPLLVTTSHALVQKYVNKNSIVKLQIKSDHVVNNRNISEEIKNVFTQSVVNNAAVRIIKLKDDTSTGLPYDQIKNWGDTSGYVQIDSADTITYNWDTSGMETGMYELQVSSTVLDQTIMSDKFNLVVR